MSDENDVASIHERWAVLRHSIIGPLLAAPPRQGELAEELRKLAKKIWRHPATGDGVSFGMSTLERWLSVAKHARDPVGALRTKVRRDKGKQMITPALKEALKTLHEQHPTWTYQLHVDNAVALEKKDPALEVPSYSTVRRHMQASGLCRQKRRGEEGSRAERHSSTTQRRSYEVTHVHSLWHLDFHACSRKLLTPRGEWKAPECFAVIDDHSRVACHVQWYWNETAEALCHGFGQAAMKRGLPRRQMTDGGPAMKAEETRRGLEKLGVLQEMTLEYSPEENAKVEHFWAVLEDRLMPMLEGVPDLSLEYFQEATQAWVEGEYNHHHHRELGESPLERLCRAPSVGRPSPTPEELQRAFCVRRTRLQRKGDGTISIEGRRYELPSRYRTLKTIHLSYARWDLSRVDMIDPRTGGVLCPLYPQDRHRNADGRREKLQPVGEAGPPPPSGVAPLLRELMAEYSASGLPPAYIPLAERPRPDNDESRSTEPEENQ